MIYRALIMVLLLYLPVQSGSIELVYRGASSEPELTLQGGNPEYVGEDFAIVLNVPFTVPASSAYGAPIPLVTAEMVWSDGCKARVETSVEFVSGQPLGSIRHAIFVVTWREPSHPNCFYENLETKDLLKRLCVLGDALLVVTCLIFGTLLFVHFGRFMRW